MQCHLARGLCPLLQAESEQANLDHTGLSRNDYIEALSEFHAERQGGARKVELFTALRDARQRYLNDLKMHACRDAASPSGSPDRITSTPPL